MSWQIADENGAPLDAHFDAEDGSLVLHSRGGTRGSPNARNTQYSTGLRLLLRRLTASELVLEGVWVDSSRVQQLPLPDRQILAPAETSMEPGEIFTLMSSRMAAVGRDRAARSGRGNSNKKIRFKFAGRPRQREIIRVAGGIPSNRSFRHLDRLPAQQLAKVSPEFIWRAVQKLSAGYSDHKFGPSTDYDVIAGEGHRLPPKAVFGLAATEALGFEVLPQHFSAGIDTPCFRAIRDAGFRIVRKDDLESPHPIPDDSEVQVWAEGRPKLVMHLRKERAPGLSRAKKAQFVREHGRLWCERCGLVPSEEFGPVKGDACIEVHHDRLSVSAMEEGHETTLDDLKCLCANCHRLVHFELRYSEPVSSH